MSIFSKCSWKFSLRPRNIPRCFWIEVSCTGLLLKTGWGWAVTFTLWLNMTSCACLLVSGLKFIFHWWAHVLILFKSLLIYDYLVFPVEGNFRNRYIHHPFYAAMCGLIGLIHNPVFLNLHHVKERWGWGIPNKQTISNIWTER